ncbi:MAG: hypothetical protein ACR2IH_00245 [Pyrinomonadaceae bacterium]
MQTAITNVICMACGVDVRSDALFCYGCGAAVVDGAATQTEAVEQPVAETFAEADNAIPADAATKSINATETNAPDRRPLTAAMLRRKKASNRQPVEVEWQVPENDSMLFAIVSVGLTLFAILVLIVALYLR